MNEETMNVYEEDDWADLMDDFGEDDHIPEETEQDGTEDTEQEQSVQTETAQDEAEVQDTETEAEQSEQQQTEDAPEELWTLKHLGAEKQVGKTEALALAQKGMDYDRIRSQRDELLAFRNTNESAVELLNTIAQERGMTLEQYTDHLRAQRIVATGVSEDAAKERVAREKAEAALAQQNQQIQAQQQQTTERMNTVKADLDRFRERYGADAYRNIPQEVWDEVNKGTLLTSAYADYVAKQKDTEIQNLKAQLKAQQQNNKNQKTSTGSRAGSVEDENDDPFLAAFMSD